MTTTTPIKFEQFTPRVPVQPPYNGLASPVRAVAFEAVAYWPPFLIMPQKTSIQESLLVRQRLYSIDCAAALIKVNPHSFSVALQGVPLDPRFARSESRSLRSPTPASDSVSWSEFVTIALYFYVSRRKPCPQSEFFKFHSLLQTYEKKQYPFLAASVYRKNRLLLRYAKWAGIRQVVEHIKWFERGLIIEDETVVGMYPLYSTNSLVVWPDVHGADPVTNEEFLPSPAVARLADACNLTLDFSDEDSKAARTRYYRLQLTDVSRSVFQNYEDAKRIERDFAGFGNFRVHQIDRSPKAMPQIPQIQAG